MNELKRFIVWCIENDIAFTKIAEAVEAFKKAEKDELVKEYYPYMGSDGTTESEADYRVYTSPR